MPNAARLATTVPFIALLPFLFWGQPSVAQPRRETFQNATVTYDWAHDNAGHRLRTFVNRPKAASAKVPASSSSVG